METRIGTDVHYAASLLRQGAVVAIPTETVYGLAANACDDAAVLRIYEVKRRPRFNPLILHFADIDAAAPYVTGLPEACRRLAARFCPGPLTFLLPKSGKVSEIVTAGSDRVAIRFPAHPMAQALLRQLDFPLAAPSANPSGYVSPVTAPHVLEGLDGLIPYVLDGGACAVGLESTIIGFGPDGISIHRHGVVDAAALTACCGLPVIGAAQSTRPEAPGALKSHYATHTPLYLGEMDALVTRYKGRRLAVLSFHRAYHHPDITASRILSPTGDLKEAARGLFQAMRDLDAAGADAILAERFPGEGIGWAINDRLQRAQAENKH